MILVFWSHYPRVEYGTDIIGVMTDVIASHHFLNFFNTTKTSTIIGAINSTFSGGGLSYNMVFAESDKN
jgi:hypothetical protein